MANYSPPALETPAQRFLRYRGLLSQVCNGLLKDNFVAIDCEMVGTGYKGWKNMVARVSVVNGIGDILYDKYVMPQDYVTDYRTPVSGIRPADLASGESFWLMRQDVAQLIEGKIVVGHALENDFAVLRLLHPPHMIRDTSNYVAYRNKMNGHKIRLRILAKNVLNLAIQEGEHNSVEDARAAMLLYICAAPAWEIYLQSPLAMYAFY